MQTEHETVSNLRADIERAIGRLIGIRAAMKHSDLLAVGVGEAADELRRIGGALVSAGTELHQAQRVAAADARADLVVGG